MGCVVRCGGSDCGSSNGGDGEGGGNDGGGGDNPWTYTSTSEQDTDSFVAQIVGGSTNTALLFADGEVFQGEKNDNGDWIFTFENFVIDFFLYKSCKLLIFFKTPDH